MSGISIEVELRDDEAQRTLQGLVNRMENRRAFFMAIGERMMASTADRFRSETDPDGLPWAPHRPSTIKARIRKGQIPLTILRSNTKGRSGSSLAGSINYAATDDEVRIGSPKETAAIHQLGGTIQKPARAAKIYRIKAADGTVGRRFAQKSKANHVTDATIPAHTITIPARRFLGPTKADEAGILDDAEDWLAL